MEKSTKKFLSILLCIAMLMSFPIVANANQAYDETFKGSYTAPSQATNTLISGDDARLTEWYGDRVNAGSKTYSVRQNQYGLNKDGNMIDAEQETKYTLWLSQYGVATFRFVVPEDGQYVISTLRNKQYSNDNKPDADGKDKDVSTLSTSLGVYDDKYNSAVFDSGSLDDEDDIDYTTVLTKEYTKGDVLYIAAGTNFCGAGRYGEVSRDLLDEYNYYFPWQIASSAKDMVYDLKIVNLSDINSENCTHGISHIVTKPEVCSGTEDRQCDLCFDRFDHKFKNNHDFKWNKTIEPKDAKCTEEQTVTYETKCNRCGYVASSGTYITRPGHKLGDDKKLVDLNDERVKEFWHHYFNNGDVDEGCDALYEGTCTKCGEYVYEPDLSPCVDEDYNVKHDFGVDESSINCQNPATCKTCGYTAAPHKYVAGKEAYKNTKCTHIYSKCSVCGDYNKNEVRHKKATYVQVTFQHDNVCGTYKIHCDECDEDLTAVLTCHSYYTIKNEDGTTTTKCARCGQLYKRENLQPGSDNGNQGGNQGGSSGGNQGGSDPSAPSSTPAPGTSDNNVNNNTTNLNNNSSTQNQPKFKRIVLNNIKAQKKGVVVAWDAAKNVTGYQLQLATDKKFKKNKKTITVTNKKVTKKTVKKLKSKKKYYVRVRAYKKQNGKRTYSSWSKTKSFKTK